MKKSILTVNNGRNERVGEFLVNRLLPMPQKKAVGPVVFLDHIYPIDLADTTAQIPNGDFAHPHRGIATFSYVLNGQLAHWDSKGHHDIINKGGVQWMKAGNGIVHDEQPSGPAGGGTFHSLQFWITLPAANKREAAEYQSVKGEDIPEIPLPGEAGTLRVLLGSFGSTSSPVKTYTHQFIYHLRIQAKSTFRWKAGTGNEFAAFVPDNTIILNGRELRKSKIAIFGNEGDEFVMENPDIVPADVFLFGGEAYNEAIVSQGPFVMNSYSEIAEAYKDFFDNKYGTIQYLKKQSV
ncbi:hypothetical protein HNQ91_002299 [Filimonas zeae]|uniref:Quercetin 2,3-dioxygenase n=1 Tax=Filimonas zeae TaxID=1737353 RepID=A0A917IW47_9BACT|nr:pirin family protein [Filimonas zeae]MDR6339248.1 hypothetical protein [Filimonas zeae]GGH64437.1 quercetin 2,3-dioxygenase [Filimonas zeae]